MRADDISVLNVLKQALGYHSDRQRVIADNVANANTPNYTPRDVSRSEFERAVEKAQQGAQPGRTGPAPVAASTTHSAHIEGRAVSTRDLRTERAPDSETTINGNSVVLEEQMVRANENRMRFETALGLYNKSLSLIRMAARPPR